VALPGRKADEDWLRERERNGSQSAELRAAGDRNKCGGGREGRGYVCFFVANLGQADGCDRGLIRGKELPEVD